MKKWQKVLLIWLAFVIVYNIAISQVTSGKMQFIQMKGEQINTATYIIPGMCRPKTKFYQEFANVLPGDVYLCNYDGTRWNEQRYADHIVEHILANNYKEVTIVSISIGDKIARAVESEDPDVKIVAINPVTRSEMLSQSFTPLKVILPIITPLIVFLGPVSDISMIPIDGVCHSLAELLSQGLDTVFDNRVMQFKATDKVIISTQDEFANNEVIYQLLDGTGAETIEIDTMHARLIESCDDYLMALEKLGVTTLD